MTRLNGALGRKQIESLTVKCLSNLIEAGKNSKDISSITLLSGEKEVCDFAKDKDIDCFLSPEGLNASVNFYRKQMIDSNMIVALGDLYFVEDFDLISDALTRVEFVVACDRHRKGSNVVGIKKSVEFDFQFGIDSYQLHIRQCISKRISIETIKDPMFSFDVDDVSDLIFLQKKWGQKN